MGHALCMTTPHSDVPLTADDDVRERVAELLDRAYRRQLWFMLLDDQQRQLPILLPFDVPRKPGSSHRAGFARSIGALAQEADADAMIVALERPGSATLGASDRAWFVLVTEACTEVGIRLRGPLLVHDDGVRWIATEDLTAPMEPVA